MMFTDYYAEARCTAGRANFITGELPVRTGMTTVGQAGSPIGISAQALTIATALKGMGYATGQFGKDAERRLGGESASVFCRRQRSQSVEMQTLERRASRQRHTKVDPCSAPAPRAAHAPLCAACAGKSSVNSGLMRSAMRRYRY